MPDEVVDSGELIYRRIPADPLYYSIQNGVLRISPSAFNDRELKPSVDRARLNNNDAKLSQLQPTDGIASLIVGDVRAIADVVQRDKDGKTNFVYKIDVIADPVDTNVAHAIIVADPKYRSKSVFNKTKEALARMVSNRGWVIAPFS